MRDVCAQFRYFCHTCNHKSAQEYVIKQHCKATHGNTNEYDDNIEVKILRLFDFFVYRKIELKIRITAFIFRIREIKLFLLK